MDNPPFIYIYIYYGLPIGNGGFDFQLSVPDSNYNLFCLDMFTSLVGMTFLGTQNVKFPVVVVVGMSPPLVSDAEESVWYIPPRH